MQRRTLIIILSVIVLILLCLLIYWLFWVRQPPEILVATVDDAFATTANTAVSGNVLDNDTPVGELTATVPPQAPPTNGTVELQPTGEFTYTPAPDYVGSDAFTYQACLTADPGQCAMATATITITVVPPTDDADAVDDVVTTLQNTPVSGNVLTNDRPPGQVTAIAGVITTQANGTFDLVSTGEFTYTPTVDFNGPDEVTYQACLTADPTNCDTATVMITVTPPPKVVDAVDDAYETKKNIPVAGNVLTNDSPSGELTASSTEFDLNATGVFTYTPASDFTGTVTLNYQACLTSDAANCDTAVVTITVKNGDTTQPVKHVVQQGEWLLQIARCYGTSPESIVYANHIPYPSWIMIGEVFVIPHVGDVSEPFNDGDCIMWRTVKAGETLESIAAEYKVDLDMLVKANYGCYGYHSYYPYVGYYGYGYHSPYIYSGCYFYGVPTVYEGQKLVIPVNNENKHLRP